MVYIWKHLQITKFSQGSPGGKVIKLFKFSRKESKIFPGDEGMTNKIILRRVWCEHIYYILENRLKKIKEDLFKPNLNYCVYLEIFLFNNISIREDGSIIDISTFAENNDHYVNIDNFFIHGNC